MAKLWEVENKIVFAVVSNVEWVGKARECGFKEQEGSFDAKLLTCWL
jgi:hypothetical protein